MRITHIVDIAEIIAIYIFNTAVKTQKETLHSVFRTLKLGLSSNVLRE